MEVTSGDLQHLLSGLDIYLGMSYVPVLVTDTFILVSSFTPLNKPEWLLVLPCVVISALIGVVSRGHMTRFKMDKKNRIQSQKNLMLHIPLLTLNQASWQCSSESIKKNDATF